jgi:hypothetical protein
MTSIIGNVRCFPELFADITDWISPAKLLTQTRPELPFSLFQRNPRVNPTQISPYPVKLNLNLTSQPTMKANPTTNPILT